MKIVAFTLLFVSLTVSAKSPITLQSFEGRFTLEKQTEGSCAKELQITAVTSDSLSVADEDVAVNGPQKIEHIDKGDISDNEGITRSQLTKNMVLTYGESYRDSSTMELDLAGKFALVLDDAGSIHSDSIRVVSVEWESNGKRQFEPDQTWRHNADLTIPKKFDNGIPETGVMLDCKYRRN